MGNQQSEMDNNQPITHCKLAITRPNCDRPLLLNPMIEILGDFLEDLPVFHEYLIIGFSPNSLPLKRRWRNNGLSADFLAEYLTTFFPRHEDDPNSIYSPDRAEIKSAVSFIANELLENAIKFNDEAFGCPISIQINLSVDRIILVATNTVSSQRSVKFQNYIKELLAGDPSEQYVHQLEKNATDETSTASGLGYLTILNDYTAKLGWKFQTLETEPEAIAVTTMVQLIV